LRAVADRLNKEWGATPVRVHAIAEYYGVTEAQYPHTLKGRGFSDAEIGTHAGLADTSLAMAIDPHLVRTDRLRAGTSLGSADGVSGDPRRSSAELGKAGVEAIVAQTVDAIKKASRSRRATHAQRLLKT
jgi:creatinine amidohydrolase/Fe(II)-dependent formamide hydrolase-like protein